MKKSIQKITAPLLALLVLLSTISWSVEKHRCMGRVMDIAFFHAADTCGMPMDLMAQAALDHHCCDNDSFTQQGQDELLLSWDGPMEVVNVFLMDCDHFYPEFQTFSSKKSIAKTTHPPPQLVHDFNLLYERFLI